MIKVTRLNGQEYYLNAELIETLEETPDTVVTLVGGKKLVVREKPDEVVERVIRYKARSREIQTPESQGGTV